MRVLTVLPVINEEMTDGCLSTISDEHRKDILIVDNSEDKFASKYKFGYLEQLDMNIGVGRSWNKGVRKLLKENYDYLVILSATMRFNQGMDDFINYIQMDSSEYGLESQHGWHCIALGKKVFETVGLFDENFYPAYYEDSDFIRRMELSGIHNPMSTTQRLPRMDINAGFEGNAHGMRKGKVSVNMGACRQYFIDKWGYEPRYDTQRNRDILYKWPFNNPANELSFWPVKSIEELKELYNLNNKE